MKHENDGNMHKRNIPVKLPQLSKARYFFIQPTNLVVLRDLSLSVKGKKVTQSHSDVKYTSLKKVASCRLVKIEAN